MFKCRNCGQELTDEIRFDLGWHCHYPCDTVIHDEDIQPERSKREDYINPHAQEFQTALKKAMECEIEEGYRCGTLNSMET